MWHTLSESKIQLLLHKVRKYLELLAFLCTILGFKENWCYSVVWPHNFLHLKTKFVWRFWCRSALLSKKVCNFAILCENVRVNLTALELVPGHQVGDDFHHLSVIFENPVTVYQASHLNFKLLCIIMCKGGKDFNS